MQSPPGIPTRHFTNKTYSIGEDCNRRGDVVSDAGGRHNWYVKMAENAEGFDPYRQASELKCNSCSVNIIYFFV
jgi:hypothetical protein